MRPLSTEEFTRMRDTQGDAMGDTCQIGVLTETTTNGHTAESYSYGTGIACGFDARQDGESTDGTQTGITSATLRLPLSTAVLDTSRIRVTHRNGAALATAEDYSVMGDPRRGPTCLTVDVRRVHGGRRG